jgi:hypothetical protein
VREAQTARELKLVHGGGGGTHRVGRKEKPTLGGRACVRKNMCTLKKDEISYIVLTIDK